MVIVRRDAEGAGAGSAGAPYVVYVEGPRDRDVLAAWARTLDPRLGRALDRAAVILGGRQPARAASHLRALRAGQPGARGLCVLDGDAGGHALPPPPEEPGLEIHIWGLRHIESYLLVATAILRVARVPDHGGRLARRLEELLPEAADDAALRAVDAKRLLDRRGPVARLLQRPLAPGRIARAMRAEELHADVLALFARIREGLGLPERELQVARRAPSDAPR